jgi:hypothetical protein
MSQVFQEIKPALYEIIGLVFTFALLFVTRYVNDLLKQNIGKKAYEELSEIVATCVRAAQQTLVLPAKNPDDKRIDWSEATADTVRRHVIASVKSVGKRAIQALVKSGMSEDAIDVLITQLVESHVLTEKGSNAALASTAQQVFSMLSNLSKKGSPPGEPPPPASSGDPAIPPPSTERPH